MTITITTPKGKRLKVIEPYGGLFDHFPAVPIDPKVLRCANCGGKRRKRSAQDHFNFRCGRCGIVIHASCFERALTPAERENFFGNDETTWAAICLRCRS